MRQGSIYIAGVSYSGKTQLRLMLSAHPNIIITRHTYLWRRFYNRYGELSNPGNLERCLVSMLALKHIQKLNPDPERIRREFWQGQPNYARLFALIHQHYAAQQGKTRWGDQYGLLENDAALIFSAESNAVIIHMVRNPLDRVDESVSISSYRKGKVGWETSLWQRSSQLAVRNLENYPHHYKIVNCEQLFSSPEKTLRDICVFLGEEFHSDMLDVEGLREMGVDVPKAFVKGEVVASRKNGAGHTSLTPTERSFVQSKAQDEMSILGYPKLDQRLSFLNKLLYAMVDYPLNMAGALLCEIWGRYKTGAPRISFDNGS